MPRATWVQTNFNGGEWSPLAWGRFDLAKYRNGLSLCLNYLPTQQGGLTRRPGTRYVAAVKDSSYAPRLQRFEFSVTQAYILEFGDGYIRFFLNDGQLLTSGVAAYNGATGYVIGDLASSGGVVYYCIAPTTGNAPPNTTYWYPQSGVVYEIPTPYSSAEVWALDFSQSADTLYITHPNHKPMKLQRAGATRWTLTTISFTDGPYLGVNATATTLTPSGTTGVVTVTASSTTGINGGSGFRASDVGRLLRLKCGGVWLWGTITAFTNSTQVTWTIAPPLGAQLPATATGVANVSGGSVFGVSLTDGGSGYGANPPSVKFSGGGGSGAIAYATLTNGVVTGVTMSVTGTGYTSAPTVTFSAPTALVPATTTFWRLGLWNATDGYPACVAFHQDRLGWAGAAQTSGRVDLSNSSDYENMAPTNLDGTVVDSNAFGVNLNSNTANAIRWMVSDEWGLLIGTAGGEWVIAPSSTQKALSFENFDAKPLGNFGSTQQLQPVRVGKATLFIQRTGRKLREMFYQFASNSFQAPDISLVSEHLTKSGIKQMCVQLAPQQIVWKVRNDGTLVGMTYDKDQEVCGWHQHRLGGYSDAARTLAPSVESLDSIPAPGIQRDEVWVIAKRYVNGAVLRTVEVLTKFWEDGDALEDATFLDLSAEYRGAPTTNVSGLTWLIGETVGVLADGANHPDCIVSAGGEIALQRSASLVQIGLRYTSAGRTLQVEAGGADGPAQGKMKRIYTVVLRLFQSLGLKLGSDMPGVGTNDVLFRTSSDAMDGPPALFDGDKRESYEGTWESDGRIYFETSDPMPSNITMLMAQLETQDHP